MDAEGDGCGLFNGKGCPDPLPETVNVPEKNTVGVQGRAQFFQVFSGCSGEDSSQIRP